MQKDYHYEIQMTQSAYQTLRQTQSLRNAFARAVITDIRYNQTQKMPGMEYKIELDRAPFEIIAKFIMSGSFKDTYHTVITRGIAGHTMFDSNIDEYRKYLKRRSYKKRLRQR